MYGWEPNTGCPRNPFTGISIFDCPEQNQTSPIKIFCNVRSSPSENVILYGPPATGVWRESFHSPFASTFVWIFLLFHEAVACTRFPEVAVPEKVTSDCCCNTILSPQMEVRVTFASVFRRNEKHINNIKYLAFNIRFLFVFDSFSIHIAEAICYFHFYFSIFITGSSMK